MTESEKREPKQRTEKTSVKTEQNLLFESSRDGNDRTTTFRIVYIYVHACAGDDNDSVSLCVSKASYL